MAGAQALDTAEGVRQEEDLMHIRRSRLPADPRPSQEDPVHPGAVGAVPARGRPAYSGVDYAAIQRCIDVVQDNSVYALAAHSCS